MTSTPPQHPHPDAGSLSQESGGAFDRAGRDRLRSGLPSLLLPRNPFSEALRPDQPPAPGARDAVATAGATPTAGPAPAPAGEAAAGLAQFHQAISDRRRNDRGTGDRRSVARPYASPWMAGPDGGAEDPRPAAAPAPDPQAGVVGPIATVMPEIPIPPQVAVLPEAVQAAVVDPSLWFSSSAPSDAPPSNAPPERSQDAPQNVPLELWQSGHALPAVPWPDATPPAAPQAGHALVAVQWPTQGPATPEPWGDLNPAATLEPMAAPEPSPARQPEPRQPQLPSAPIAMPIATVPATPPPQPPLGATPAMAAAGAGADIAELQRQIAQAASPPASSLEPGGTGQAHSGSLLTRLFWMLGAPAAAGAGVGYLLSLALR